jgi:hypothetical protein
LKEEDRKDEVTTTLLPSFQSSSLLLSLIPIHPPHYLSPSFLSGEVVRRIERKEGERQ